MSFELILICFLILLAVLIVIRISYQAYRRRTALYFTGDVEEAITAFQENTAPFLKQLEAPHTCDEGVIAIKNLRQHYVKLLKRANRNPENSKEYQAIFSQALNPVLDKISHASTSRECFKNIAFKKAFDQFIKTVQNQGKFRRQN